MNKRCALISLLVFPVLVIMLGISPRTPWDKPLPPGDHEAQKLYDKILHHYAEASALDFLANIVEVKPREDGGGNTISRGELRFRLAKPLSGSFRRVLTTNGEESTVYLVADGVGVAYLDHEQKTYLEFGDTFAIFCDMIKLDPLYAWAGIKVLEPERLELLKGTRERKKLLGLAIVGVEFRQEIWVDSTGRMVYASVIHNNKLDEAGQRRDFSIGRTEYTFLKMDLYSKAKPDDFVARVPEDYKLMDTPNQTDDKLLALGTHAPNVTLTDMDDLSFELSSLQGKTVLLDFWFYHCFGCRQEMPNLQRLWSEISRKRRDVVFLCVNLGDSKKVIKQWWKTEKFTLKPVMQKKNEVSKVFGVKGYPTHYILGPDGEIIYRSTGFDEKSIRAALDTTARRDDR